MATSDCADRFESLGHGCELGMFQRYCLAEPLGLFRFATSRIENVITVLENRMEVFQDDDLGLRIDTFLGEYRGYSRSFDDFDYHTFYFQDKISEERVRQKEQKKLTYLRSFLAARLANDEKIAVRTGHDDPKRIEQLSRLLKRLGTTWLLWVSVSDEGHPPGVVEQVGDGLLRGYVSRLATFHDEPNLDLRGWLGVTRSALRIVEERAGRAPPVFEANVGAAVEAAVRDGDYRHLSYPDPRRRLPCAASCFHFEREVPAAEPLVTARIEPSFHPRTPFVLSAWVWLPEAFRGHFVILDADGITALHRRKADLSRRGTWQQIWVSGRLPKMRGPLVFNFRVAAQAGDTIAIGLWRLETGTIPTEHAPAEAAPDLRLSQYRATLRRGYLAAVRTLRARRRFDRADRLAVHALSLFPHDLDFYLAYARTADARQRFDLAVARWTLALRAAPGLVECHVALAAAFRGDGAIERAGATIEVALRLFPEDAGVHAEASRIARARGRNIEAARHAKLALAEKLSATTAYQSA